MRVLIVDHTAGILPFRRKFETLASHPDLDLTVLAPERWVENYRSVRAVETRENGYRLLTGRVVWPGYENRGFFISGLDRAFRETRPELVHLWEEPFSFIAFEAITCARVRSPHVPIIFSTSDDLSRDFRYPYRPSRLYAAIERSTLRRAAGATVMNETVQRLLREKGFSKPVERITHGLDLKQYPCSLEARDAGRDDTNRRPVVGFLGRLTHQKGVDVLLEAWSRLARASWEVPPVLEIVGAGPERARLEDLARRLELGGRVRFRPPVRHEEVPSVLAGFDVLVLPSRTIPTSQEHFGRVLIEGMAAGCVVIGTRSGAIPEVIADAGMLVAEQNGEALAGAIARALRDPDLAATLRRRSRDRVRAHYTWDVIASRLAAFYRRVHGQTSVEAR